MDNLEHISSQLHAFNVKLFGVGNGLRKETIDLYLELKKMDFEKLQKENKKLKDENKELNDANYRMSQNFINIKRLCELSDLQFNHEELYQGE